MVPHSGQARGGWARGEVVAAGGGRSPAGILGAAIEDGPDRGDQKTNRDRYPIREINVQIRPARPMVGVPGECQFVCECEKEIILREREGISGVGSEMPIIA